MTNPRTPDAGDATPCRAQTGMDFLVGMSVFLVVVGFVFSFLPGVFQPFTQASGADLSVADRTAVRLSEDLLVEDPVQPNVLNQTCTTAFFAGGSVPDGCRYETTNLRQSLGLGPTADVNLTIVDNSGTIYARGPAPEGGIDVSVSKRVVYLDGHDRRLVVRVW